MRRVLASFIALVLAWFAVPAAQTARSVTVRVSESMGISRTQYPVRAVVPLPQGAITETGQARLRLKDADVPAQLTAMAKWPDGSIRTLDADFNVTLSPSEAREYVLQYGGAATAPAAGGRGLTVTEDATTIGFSNIKLGKNGWPLITSANYAKTELIGQGANGLVLVDAAGGKHDLSSAQNLKVEVLKRGPLMVAVQYSGTVPIDAKYGAAFTLLVEMPNSKSWLKFSADVTDPERRVKTVALDTPLALGTFPWLWDVGTATDTYGAIRNAMDGMAFTQVTGPAAGASNWKVETRAQGELRPYEVAPGTIAKGWGHMVGSTAALAFAFEGFGRPDGTHTVSFDGQGQASFSITPAAGATAHRLRLYQHYVSTPVPIGAATSPASMANPPTVTVK